MKLERAPIGKLKRDILETIGKYADLGKYKIFIFGSRISGSSDERSDIDIGIEGKQPMPPEALAKIREEIENLPYLYKIEIVDFKTVSNDFYKIAKKNIELLN